MALRVRFHCATSSVLSTSAPGPKLPLGPESRGQPCTYDRKRICRYYRAAFTFGYRIFPVRSTRKRPPPLIFIAAVLALLLAILEVDLHGAPLQSLGLTGTQPDLANFMGP